MYIKRFKKDHIVEIKELYINKNAISDYELIGEGYEHSGANNKMFHNDYVLLSSSNYELLQTALLIICEELRKGANCINMDDIFYDAYETLEEANNEEI